MRVELTGDGVDASCLQPLDEAVDEEEDDSPSDEDDEELEDEEELVEDEDDELEELELEDAV